MKYKLLYMNVEVEVFQTPYGFNEVVGIDNYWGASLRSKVVFRIDLFDALTDIISSSILKKHRDLIYKVIAGVIIDRKVISQVFTALYLEDEKFKIFLGEVVYYNTMLKEISLYDVLLIEIHKRLNIARNKLYDKFSVCTVKIIDESACFIYCAIDDRRMTVTLPKGFRGEVVSHGKIWKGSFA